MMNVMHYPLLNPNLLILLEIGIRCLISLLNLQHQTHKLIVNHLIHLLLTFCSIHVYLNLIVIKIFEYIRKLEIILIIKFYFLTNNLQDMSN